MGAASHSHARAKLPQAWLMNLLTQPIIISVLHTPPRTLQPQGLCTCRAPCLECSFSAPPPPSVSVRLAPWLCHPTQSPSECSPARFPRGRDCHSEGSAPRFVLHYHLPPPVKARTWPLQSTAGSPVPGDSQGSIRLGSRHSSAHPTDHGT